MIGDNIYILLLYLASRCSLNLHMHFVKYAYLIQHAFSKIFITNRDAYNGISKHIDPNPSVYGFESFSSNPKIRVASNI